MTKLILMPGMEAYRLIVFAGTEPARPILPLATCLALRATGHQACNRDTRRYNNDICQFSGLAAESSVVAEYDLPNAECRMPNAELDVMRCLWQGRPRTAREIREMLKTDRPMSHSSVCTLLRRLEAKDFVVHEKGTSGKAFIYRAAVQPTRTRRRLVGDLLDRLFAGNGVDLVVALFESRPPTETQLNDLQNLLDDLRNRRPRSGSKARGPAASGDTAGRNAAR